MNIAPIMVSSAGFADVVDRVCILQDRVRFDLVA
jgi:hypothetical protein